MTALSPELEALFSGKAHAVPKVPRTFNERWIGRLWQLFRDHDFDVFASHLKIMPPVSNSFNGVDSHPIFPYINTGERIFGRACSEGRDIKWLDLLLKYGSKEIQTGLYCASMTGQLEIIEWLLERGADPMLPDANGSFPLDGAIMEHQFRSIVFWAERYPEMVVSLPRSGFNPLFCVNFSALHCRTPEILEYLLNLARKHRMLANWINAIYGGRCLLQSVAIQLRGPEEDYLVLVQMLLSAGAEVNEAVIDYAIRRHSYPLAELVIATSSFVSDHVTEKRRLELRGKTYFDTPLVRRLIAIC